MILKKLGDEYKLYSHDSCIATTQESPHKRLSKQNCDEMFGIIDVGALALEECNNTDPLRLDSQKYKQDPYFRIGYLKGFNKAMELNKDKLFTIEDMISAYHQGANDGVSYESACGDHVSYEQMKEAKKESEDDYSYFIESLQQPTEIEVEIVTHVDLAATPVDSRHPDAYLGTNTGIPFLDKNGCLILKKK